MVVVLFPDGLPAAAQTVGQAFKRVNSSVVVVRTTESQGRTADHEMAQFALIEMRGAGRLAFGGFFEDGETFALARTADAEEALGRLRATGFWLAGHFPGQE